MVNLFICQCDMCLSDCEDHCYMGSRIGSRKTCISVCLHCPMEGWSMCMASPRRAPNSPRRMEGGGAPHLALPP